MIELTLEQKELIRDVFADPDSFPSEDYDDAVNIEAWTIEQIS